MIIRKNDDGSIDEIVATGKIHIEQMSADGWFIGIEAADGSYHQFWLGAKNRKSHVEVRHTESVKDKNTREAIRLSRAAVEDMVDNT